MSNVHVRTGTSYAEVANLISSWLPVCDPATIFIKPNWVKHQVSPSFPITALVTSPVLIEAVVDACIAKYPHAQTITVGDVPLQSCDFALLKAQSGIDTIEKKYQHLNRPRVRFIDLRRERWRENNGFLEMSDNAEGDPSGYAEVVIDESSYLEEVAHLSHLFRVSDYDPSETRVAHRPGYHRYLISRSILEADLFINLPKMKTHQKAGITGALKNLVGINGSKAFLVHHRHGTSATGGDEFPPDVDSVFVLQARLREGFQKRSRLFYRFLRSGWKIVKRVRGIETLGTAENLGKRFYVGSGSWYGNDSIWRMVFDLNRIILLASADGGPLRSDAQREYYCIVDGIVAGEGNGPLQPLPVSAGVLIGGDNPFAVDWGMAVLMGYQPERIVTLKNYRLFRGGPWQGWEPENDSVDLNGQSVRMGYRSLAPVHQFLPPPGWGGHVEAGPPIGDGR